MADEARVEWVDLEPAAELRRDGKQVGRAFKTPRGWAWAAQYGGLYESSEASGSYFGDRASAMDACSKWCRRLGCA